VDVEVTASLRDVEDLLLLLGGATFRGSVRVGKLASGRYAGSLLSLAGIKVSSLLSLACTKVGACLAWPASRWVRRDLVPSSRYRQCQTRSARVIWPATHQFPQKSLPEAPLPQSRAITRRGDSSP
jgi:hypothetical protein